ncbi:MAG: PD-(D/E)XK nuclease family protein [Candidatus Cloacimonetes bacterium]|jgi:hypothetical protein|nr:PD-(D/E)XK nuclease family protein [Candidatus Cloacimonadota bacterium]
MGQTNNPNYDRFRELITDDDFIQLRQLTTKFSIFDVMRATHTEIRHSNILAWLLSPYETHGCGDAFLREFLVSISKDLCKLGLDFNRLYTLETESVEIKREWAPTKKTKTKKDVDPVLDNEDPEQDSSDEADSGNRLKGRIDIVLELELKHNSKETDKGSGQKNSEEPINKIVIAIENKIRSSESIRNNESQLEGYWKVLTKEFENKELIVPIFLTPDGIDPMDNNNWIKLTYDNVHKSISKVFDLHKADMSGDKQLFIKQYLDLLNNHIVSGLDQQKSLLCRSLNQKHLWALEKIRKETQPSKDKNEDDLHRLCQHIYNDNQAVFKNYNEWLFGTRDRIHDLLKEWLDDNRDKYLLEVTKDKKHYIEFVEPYLKGINKGLFDGKENLVFFFYNNLNYNLTLHVEIKSYSDQIRRRAVYEVFQEDESDLFRPSKNITDKYTRVYSTTLCTYNDAVKEISEEDVFKLISNNVDNFFSENGKFMRIQKFLIENKEKFLALKG